MTRSQDPQAPVALVLGTRPEAIKLVPVFRALQARAVPARLIATAQHREMLDQVLRRHDLRPDLDLEVMREGQTLNGLLGRLLTSLDGAFESERPSLVVVQGDTTTALAGAQAAFHREIPIAHVEAGLRSGDLRNPFPEEANRRLISTLAALHFAPTRRAGRDLEREGTPAERILVTGNTAVDAVLGHARPAAAPVELGQGQRLLLVTSHRRESFDGGLAQTFEALRRIAASHDDVVICFPVHLNPKVRGPAYELLGGQERIHLLDPLGHDAFVAALRAAHLVLTDSGGVQEEAPSFGKPLLLLRELTERPEAVEAGAAVVVGTDTERIVAETSRLLHDDDAYRRMAAVPNPFGDGRAAERIALAIERWRAGQSPPLTEHEQFSRLTAEAAPELLELVEDQLELRQGLVRLPRLPVEVAELEPHQRDDGAAVLELVRHLLEALDRPLHLAALLVDLHDAFDDHVHGGARLVGHVHELLLEGQVVLHEPHEQCGISARVGGLGLEARTRPEQAQGEDERHPEGDSGRTRVFHVECSFPVRSRAPLDLDATATSVKRRENDALMHRSEVRVG